MTRRDRRRVVVTGAGAITPVGNTAPATWEALAAGCSGVGPVTLFDARAYPSQIAAEVKNFDPEQFIDRKEARRIARASQLAIVAAREAVTDAGIAWDHEDRERAGVIMGTGIGCVEMLVDPIWKMKETGVARTNPLTALGALANMPAFHIGMEHGCLGPLSTVVTACASGAQAIGDAMEMIRRGTTDVMLAGGVEGQVNGIFFGGFSALRNLSTRNDDPAGASRPFDGERDGLVIGEAAAVLVLEDLEHAQARGAQIYAELLGQSASSDAYHIAQPDPAGAGAARAMRWALNDAEIAPDTIDYINAHGTATRAGDPAETAAIKQVFGERAYQIPISSTKSMTGHCFGASGALEAIACIMSLRTGILHPTINQEHPDPECDLDYVPNVARKSPIKVALTNAFGFGGQNACLVIGKWQS
ncbi:MAG TPA: beta-ketoacyl-ACP synthase II [Anaerolineae bacterium]